MVTFHLALPIQFLTSLHFSSNTADELRLVLSFNLKNDLMLFRTYKGLKTTLTICSSLYKEINSLFNFISAIQDKAFYKKKIHRLINDEVSEGVYVIERNGNTLAKLKSLQNFLYKNFKKPKKQKGMRPAYSQPARLFATVKAHKFTGIKQININNLNLSNNRPNWHPFIRLLENNCPIFKTVSVKEIYNFQYFTLTLSLKNSCKILVKNIYLTMWICYLKVFLQMK